MSHPIIYGEKTLTLTSPAIDFNSDATQMTYNGSAILTAASRATATGTITGTPTVDTGAVSTFTTRGTLATNAVVTWTTTVQTGMPTKVQVRIPAVKLVTFTGAPTVFYPVGVATVLPSAARPGVADVPFVIDGVNNTAAVAIRLTISTAGVISCNITAGTAVTAAFGMAGDFVANYIVTSV